MRYVIVATLAAAGLVGCSVAIADGNEDGVTAPRGPSAVTAPPPPGELVRVGGDVDAAVQRKNGEYLSAGLRIDTPLPEGYPAPTPPGAIDLKGYPSVRRAEFTGEGAVDRGQNRGFWPLFQHIKDREIAMTAPVEMELRDWEVDSAQPPSAWTMAFLYRSANLGPIGEDGAVIVRDAEPVTVVAIGLRGEYRQARFDAALDTLSQWLEANPAWERAGEARWLGYNGPTWFRAKWSEVQIPVRAVAASQEGDPEPSVPEVGAGSDE